MIVRSKDNAGFTLLELMIGAAVLIIALVGLIAAFTGCFALNEGARNMTIAINDAQCVMEEIRDRNLIANITQEDWTSWAQTDPPDGGGCNTLVDEMVQVGYPLGTNADPLEILIIVSWREKGGRWRDAQLVTLLTER